MTATELSTEQEEMWRTFFDDNHVDLVLVAEMLLRCHLSHGKILRKALSGLKSSPSEVTFEQAIGAVINTAKVEAGANLYLPLSQRPRAGG